MTLRVAWRTLALLALPGLAQESECREAAGGELVHGNLPPGMGSWGKRVELSFIKKVRSQQRQFENYGAWFVSRNQRGREFLAFALTQ